MIEADEVRELALSFPEAEQSLHWDKPSFRVRGKIFAVIQPDGVSLVIKTSKEERYVLTAAEPDIYQMPPSFANLAYMIVRLDRVDREAFRSLLEQAWKQVAPKKVIAAYDARA